MDRIGRISLIVVVLASLVLLHVGCVSEQVRMQRERERVERQRSESLAGMEVSVLDSFDGTLAWRLDAGQSDPAEVGQTEPKAGAKDRAMDIKFKLGEKKKIVIGCRLTPPSDLSKEGLLVVDVRSGLAGRCPVSLGLLTMPGWKYCESPKEVVWPGENPNVGFRLDLPNFKSEESKWRYSQRVPNLSAVGKLVLIFHPAGGGSVQVDNLRRAKLKLIPEPQPND